MCGIEEMTYKPFEYYLNLIKNGDDLTDVEISNAKKLLRFGYNSNLEKCLAVVRRNRDESPGWNQWYYNRYGRTPEEEVRDGDVGI